MPSFKKLKEIVDRCNKNKISAKKVSSGCEKVHLSNLDIFMFVS